MAKATTISTLKGELPLFQERLTLEASLAATPGLANYLAFYGFNDSLDASDAFQIASVVSGDYRIACCRWQKQAASADILVTHGLFDHIGLYLPLVNHLLGLKLNVVAFDLPEHGISSGEFGGVSSFDTYAKALVDVVEEFDLGSERPFIALGQSTGAAVLMSALLGAQKKRFCLNVAALIYLAPLLRVRGWKRVNFSYFWLKRFVKYVPRSFSRNSHDADFCQFLKHQDPLQPRKISVAWVKAMLDWSQQFSELRSSELPGMIIQGSADNTVDVDYNLANISRTFPNLAVQVVGGAFHHLVREAPAWQDQVFSGISSAIHACNISQ